MTHATFNAILKSRLARTESILSTKAKEYAVGDNRTHNFERAAGLLGCTPVRAALGMAVKHWVSVADIVDRHSRGENIDPLVVDEKVGDAINYLILIEAILKEPS